MRKTLVTAALGTIAAIAAGGVAADQKTEQVRVEASRIVQTDAGHSYTGTPIRKISLSYEVSLDDLDLGSSTGLATAEQRVNNAAAEACKEIGRQSPAAQPMDSDCAKAAARPAIAKLHEAAAAVTRAPAKK